jgi:hypothetical protein
MRGNNFQKVANVGLVWFNLGEKDKKTFLSKQDFEVVLPVTE